MEVEYYEYKGSEIMKIVTGTSPDGKTKYGISFGKKKAQAILECVDDIRRFAGEDMPEPKSIPDPETEDQIPF